MKHASPLYKLGAENRTFSGDKLAIERLQSSRLVIQKTEFDFVPEFHLDSIRVSDIVATESNCYAIDEAGTVWVVEINVSMTAMNAKKPVRLKIQETVL